MTETTSASAAPSAPFQAVALTLFPDMFPGPLGVSLLGRALERGLWSLKTIDFRAFARDKHRTVDDTPCGGGPGLVLKPDIAAAAVDAALEMVRARSPGEDASPALLCLTPRGRPFTQAIARRIAAGPGVVLLCGRFEGVDQRVIDARGMEEIAVGDAVLTGGEIPAMAVLDAVVRLLPGVVGDPASLDEESFAAGLLEHPQYTRPAVWEGRPVPDVLLSGDHGRVAAWRRAAAEQATQERRPDLWRAHRTRMAPPEQSDGTNTGDDPATAGRAAQERDED